MGRPDTVVVSWNTPLNPAVTIGSEPAIAGEPAGPNDDPIAATLSETTITSDFLGAINLHVTGLQAGQSALLERFKTPTPVAPVGDPLTVPISSARMKDGFVSESGEVANFNVLNDVDETPGNVTVQLNFLEPGLAQFPGNYLYRVSSPFGAFDPVEVRFTVTEAPTSMKFTGQVTHQGNPVPYALVGALDPVGTSFDFSYNDLIAGATADANGNYELYVPYPSEFDVVAAFPGYAGNYGAGVSHVIASGETIAVDLELEIGTQTVSGTLADTDGDPLPGVELVFVSLGADMVIDFESFALGSTGSGGAFSAQLPPGRWGVTVRVNTAADLGYMTPRDLLARFDLTAGPAENIELILARGDSLIWGSVLSVDETDENGGPLPLEGIKMIAIHTDGLSASWGVTDADGDFRIAARPGTWLVRPLSQSLWNQYYGGTEQHTVHIPAPFSSVENDFLVRRSAGDLYGTVTRNDDSPVGRLTLLAVGLDPFLPEVERQLTHQEDGYYNFGLPAGSWRIVPDAEQAAQQQLLLRFDAPVVEFAPLQEGVSAGHEDYPRFEFTIDAIDPETTLAITVTDPDGAPVAGVIIEATSEHLGLPLLAYGHTDGNGVATIPVIPGEWTLSYASPVLRIKGFRAPEDMVVEVPGPTPVEEAVELAAFTYEPPTVDISLDEDGDVFLLGKGEPGLRYRIQASSDLKTWYEQGSATAVDGSIYFYQRDPSSIEGTFRSYRLATEQP